MTVQTQTSKDVNKKALKSYVVKELDNAKKIVREFEFTGTIIHAEDYVTNKKGLAGISFEVEGMPYRLRVLKGSLKGGSKASHFLNCDVQFTGVEREYDGNMYFDPKDAKIVTYSNLANLSRSGVSFSGSLV